MHEMSLAESMLQIIEDAARKDGFTQVKTVWLEIGQLACVEKESLCFSFEQVKKDSIAEQARLEIIEIGGKGWCSQCNSQVALPALLGPCPACGNYRVTVTDGDQFRIRELEVE
ncbi:MAG TPA: hydrogenase maturation nickel metallochaperone HypA [Gallionellaceae bacterium]